MTCRPDTATGSRSALSVQEESCWGTIGTSQEALGIDFTRESLRNQRNTIESTLIRSDRMRAPSQAGNERPGGEIFGELQPHGAWPLILKHALGGAVSTSGSGPYTHALEGSVDLPEGLTIEKKFGFPSGNLRLLRYLGSKVNEFGLEIPTEGIVTARAGIIARQESRPVTEMDATPTYPLNNEPFNSFQGAILLDAAGDGTAEVFATLTSLSLLINNNIDGDRFAIDGTSYRADAPEDVRIVNGRMSAFFTYDNWQLYQSFINDLTLSMTCTLTRGSYIWQFTIPALKIRGDVTPVIDGRGPVDINMEWEAERDDTTGTDIQVSIVNDDPDISTAA